MKVLITGINGYIGSHFAKTSLNRGWKVEGIVREQSNLELLQRNGILKKVKLHRISGGVTELTSVLKRSKPDVVIHLATLYLATHQPNQVSSLISSNIQFGAELLEAMKVTGIKSLINAETAWQYQPQGKLRSVNLYAATKQAFVALIDYYVEAHGMNAVRFKLFDTYGGIDTRPKLFNKLKEIAKSGQFLELSKGEQILDFTHIDDVCEALTLGVKKLLKPKGGVSEEYAIQGKRLSLRNWIWTIEMLLKRPLPVILGAQPYRVREVMKPWEKGRVIPGWKCKIGFKKGLKAFFEL